MASSTSRRRASVEIIAQSGCGCLKLPHPLTHLHLYLHLHPVNLCPQTVHHSLPVHQQQPLHLCSELEALHLLRTQMRQERGGYTTKHARSHTHHMSIQTHTSHTQNTNIYNGAKPLSSSRLPGLQMEKTLRGGEEGRSDKGIPDVKG